MPTKDIKILRACENPKCGKSALVMRMKVPTDKAYRNMTPEQRAAAVNKAVDKGVTICPVCKKKQ